MENTDKQTSLLHEHNSEYPLLGWSDKVLTDMEISKLLMSSN